MTRTASQYDSVIDIGCGSGSLIKSIKSPHRWGVDACENAINAAKGSNNGVNFIVGDIREPSSLFKEKVDCVVGVDIIEHFEKKEAYKLILDYEDITDFCLMFFIPVGNHPQTKDDRGFNNDYYQTHRSTWYPEDMIELDYQVHYYPEWHKNIGLGKDTGAMFCIKRLG